MRSTVMLAACYLVLTGCAMDGIGGRGGDISSQRLQSKSVGAPNFQTPNCPPGYSDSGGGCTSSGGGGGGSSGGGGGGSVPPGPAGGGGVGVPTINGGTTADESSVTTPYAACIVIGDATNRRLRYDFRTQSALHWTATATTTFTSRRAPSSMDNAPVAATSMTA